ncbi:inositol monophosphatase family protein [Halostella pelagica]|uniref:inositol monophosphatase family protein n=1 Tax=Halostella pelagica TaxID=2583824 RepID=UPI0010808CEE|nr:inositol monophosphatase [Halostella pelagica]
MADSESERAAVTTRAAREGAAVAADYFRTDLAVETKDGDTDVVTRADREAQERVIETIRADYPDVTIVGEENDAPTTVPDEGSAFVVDPIDGTNNFVRGVPFWCTSVAAVADGEPVAAATVAPAVGDEFLADDTTARLNGDELSVSRRDGPETATVSPTLWWDFDSRDEYAAAAEGIVERFADLRRYGSAQISLGYVAMGALDGVFSNLRGNPWDTVAGVHLVRCAGGEATDLEGNRWHHDSRGLVVSNGAVHDAVLSTARDAEAQRG